MLQNGRNGVTVDKNQAPTLEKNTLSQASMREKGLPRRTFGPRPRVFDRKDPRCQRRMSTFTRVAPYEFVKPFTDTNHTKVRVKI